METVREKIHARLDQYVEAAIDTPGQDTSENEVQNEKSKHSFADLMTNIASKKTTRPKDTINKDPIDALIEEYLNSPTMPMSGDPLMFWKEWHESGDPLKQKFSELAVEYLTPPGTSVDAERLFSTASDVVPKDANKTNPENLEKKLFCHNNLPAVNFEY